MKANEKNSVKIHPDVAQEMRIHKATTGKQIQDLISEAWALYTKKEPPEKPQYTREEQKWIDKLLFILQSGDKGCIQAVCNNLVQFELKVKLASQLDSQLATTKKRA